MRYWFDTEFIEDGDTIKLLSIGIVAEDGRELYLETELAHREVAYPEYSNEWVRANVLPYLGKTDFAASLADLSANIKMFCDPQQYGRPEFWGYYADYDWVAFCQIFGRMIDLPKGYPMYCRDIKQLCDDLGNPKLPPQVRPEHYALADAFWNKEAYEFLTGVVSAERAVIEAAEEWRNDPAQTSRCMELRIAVDEIRAAREALRKFKEETGGN